MLLEGGFRQWLEELGLWEGLKRADSASGWVIEDAEREKISSGWREWDVKVVRMRVAVDRVGDMEGGMEWLARNVA